MAKRLITKTDPADLNQRRKAFCAHYAVHFNGAQAAREAGYSATRANHTARELLEMPAIKAEIARINAERAERIDTEAFDVIGKTREVVERCMVAVPVTDRRGNPIDGEWTFDANAALRGLELLGKHEGLFNTNLNVTLNEHKAREVIQRALKVVSTHVTPDVFRAIVADLEDQEDA